MSVGGVDFYSHQMWPEGVRLGPPHETRRHPEFDDEWHTLFFRTLPEEPFVIAGVPLGDGLIADAVARARSTAQHLVRAARPQSSWILIPGAAIYVREGNPGYYQTFVWTANDAARQGRFGKGMAVAQEIKGEVAQARWWRNRT